jgi:acetyltransferase
VSGLGDLFTPDRVAVIGATDRDGSVGRALLTNLATFDGEVLAVNPNRETVLGRRCHPRIGAVPDPSSVDLAVVAVPASTAVDVVRQVGEAGIRNVVVITAGFGEAGERGRRRERELVAVAEAYDLTLVGPNCVGLVSTPNGLNATFVRGRPPAGNVSLLSQSGAFVAATLGWAARHGVGFRHVVSLGNEAALDETDFLAEWGSDPGTDVIVAYLEDVDDGRAFIAAAREVTAHTPVVVLKSGRTAAGAEAVASHTGSIAGSDRANRAGFDRAGVLRADTVQEAFDVSRALAGHPLPADDGVAVVTNGGGLGVLATDAIGESRLSVAEFGADTRAGLAELLPDDTTVANPLDVVGDADVTRFRRTLDVVLGAGTVGSVVVLAVPTAPLDLDALAGAIVDRTRRHGKPIVTCLMGGADADRAVETLAEHGLPNHFDPARAVASLAALADYRDVRGRTRGSVATFDVDRDRAGAVLKTAVDRGVDRLGVEAMGLLDAYGIPTPPGGLATSAADAGAIAERIGGPVALKIVSPDVVHKSDVGGVEVGVPVRNVRDAYRTIRERVGAAVDDPTILGVRVERTVDPAAGTETIVGGTHDAQFGHLVMFGLGGVFVQVFDDTSVRVAPVTEREAREMTAEIRAAPMLRGARGRPSADLDAVVEAIQRVSQLVTDFPAITELDVNPLVAGPDGVCAVDLRLTVDRQRLSAT